MSRRVRLLATAAAIVLAPYLGAQESSSVAGTVAAAVHVQSFSFKSGSDARSATLFLAPFSFQRAIGSRAAVDGYAAYGVGRVGVDSQQFEFRGPVDSWLRLRVAASRSTVLAIGVALPTGIERHTSEQSVVANVLSNDLLGFREATWGSGGSATMGVSVARSRGLWRLTTGASYKITRQFLPSADTTVTFSPGNETRVRVGMERAGRSGALFLGLTAQHLGADKADKRNLFQPGARLRGDLSYTSPSWSLAFANLWRANGDLTLPVVNLLDGSFLRDTTFVVGWQNLSIASANRTVSLGNGVLFIPNGEVKLRTRAGPVGRGWLAAVGAAVPFSALGAEFFPSAKGSMGTLVPSVDPASRRPLWGAEVSLVVRHSTRRTAMARAR